MTNQLKIEVGDTVRIAGTSVHYNRAEESNPKCDGVVVEYCGTLDVDWDNGFSNTYQSYDLILIKKGKTMKEFTKSYLKTGMFVKYRGGHYRVVIGDFLSGKGCASLSQYSDNLKYVGDTYKALDIMAVYKASGGTNMDEYLSGQRLTLIWERTEQTPAQKEMEVLQVKMNESQAKMNELQAQMKVVQAKL
jgi:hypothetical protein